jgi:hypothetical protein
MRLLASATRKQRAAWAILVAVGIVTAGLSYLAVRNYSEVVETRILTAVSFDASMVPRYEASNLTGLTLEISLLVENPGDREVRVWTIGYRGWIRDLPVEMGVNWSRGGVDATVYPGGETKWRYYPVFTFSWIPEVHGIVVPASTSERVVVLNKTFVRSDSPETFDSLDEIYAYTTGEAEWRSYCFVVLFVEGPPRGYIGSGSAYLTELVTTHRYFGELMGSGNAGLVEAP